MPRKSAPIFLIVFAIVITAMVVTVAIGPHRHISFSLDPGDEEGEEAEEEQAAAAAALPVIVLTLGGLHLVYDGVIWKTPRSVAVDPR